MAEGLARSRAGACLGRDRRVFFQSNQAPNRCQLSGWAKGNFPRDLPDRPDQDAAFFVTQSLSMKRLACWRASRTRLTPRKRIYVDSNALTLVLRMTYVKYTDGSWHGCRMKLRQIEDPFWRNLLSSQDYSGQWVVSMKTQVAPKSWVSWGLRLNHARKCLHFIRRQSPARCA